MLGICGDVRGEILSSAGKHMESSFGDGTIFPSTFGLGTKNRDNDRGLDQLFLKRARCFWFPGVGRKSGGEGGDGVGGIFGSSGVAVAWSAKFKTEENTAGERGSGTCDWTENRFEDF